MANLSRTMIGLLLGAAVMTPAVAQAQARGENRSGENVERADRDRGPTMHDARREAIEQGREAARAVERPAPVIQPRVDGGGDQRRSWDRSGQDTNRERTDIRQRDTARDSDRNETRRRDTVRDGNRGWNRDRGDEHNERSTTDRREGDRDRDERWTTDRRQWDRDRDNDRNWSNDRDRRGNDRWDQNWRNDRRYAWQDYRSRHRDVYRAPRYVPPRHGYSYRRWSPGYRFDPWYYGSGYWISDPWFYRLPPAYGHYRWVRYFDDAALVDIRTGVIVDIIYAFFL